MRFGQEVDAQKIVFNAHYLMYADVAVSPVLESKWPLALRAKLGARWAASCFVKKATTTYHASARWAMC